MEFENNSLSLEDLLELFNNLKFYKETFLERLSFLR